MKLTVQLYIGSSQVELFDDESISVTSSIQNVKDIAKIFTDFSQSFSVPASRNNNKIFKHFYNFDVDNGFDARVKASAELQINYVPFRKGKIRLEGVQMKNNVAYAYKLVFYGNTVTLKDLLGEDMLSSLSYLDNYNFTLNNTNIKTGLESGLTLNSQSEAVIYPLISPEYRYIYDSSGTASTLTKTRNIKSSTLSDDGACIHSEDLKPAIRLYHILEAIEDKYGLTFSTDFFADNGTDNPEFRDFYDLYMWLHREQGINVLSNEVEFLIDSIVPESEWNGVTFYSDNFTIQYVQSGYCSPDYIDTDIDISVTDTATTFDFIVTQDGTTIFESNDNTGNTSYNFDIGGLVDGEYKIYVTTSDTDTFSGTINVAVIADTECPENGATNSATIGNKSSVSDIELVITNQLPEMKVLDFLTGIFKMFNLTAYIEDDVIVVKPLDDFYSEGTTYDISQYVDVETSEVKSTPLYSEMTFKYKDEKTFLAINYKNINNESFGALYYKPMANDLVLGGGRYAIELPFEHMVYERLTDENTGSLSDVGYGYFVDNSQNPVVGAPLIFYKQNQGTATIYLRDLEDTIASPITTYNRPSNNRSEILGGFYIPYNSINFGLEVDEYYTSESNDNTLFNDYYTTYISSVYDIKSRLTKITAYLPLKILSKYTLADTFIINQKSYRINSISTDLATGKSQIELLNIV